MKKVFKNISVYANLLVSLFNALMFFSMKYCWSGISKVLGCEKGNFNFLYHLPIYICVLLFLITIANFTIYFIFKKEKMLVNYIFNGVNLVFLIAIFAIIKLGATDYMYFIWPKFFMYFAITLACFALAFLIVYYPKSKLKDNKIFKLCFLLVIALCPCLFVFNASVNNFTYKPVVYAVEDEYQIVFTTSTKSTGWVTIGDKCYYDTYAGYMKSEDTVHKICVPMSELDNAKAYTVHTKKMIYRGPFGAFQGQEKTLDYSFKPVDGSDGLNYYCLSDVHMDTKGAINSANQDPDLELLVLAGDMISLVDSQDNANYVNKIAYGITKGEKPVVYARGNHELKCSYSDKLYKYVGSKDQKFYYTFTLNDVFGIVLDMGEDHEDDYFEYYNTALFDEYREEQTEFLKEVLEKNEYQNYKYRMVVCHIPVIYIDSKAHHEKYIKDWTEQLNKFDLDICLSGHKHLLYVFEPNTLEPLEKLQYNTAYDESGKVISCKVTNFNFPTFLIGKRGVTQLDDVPLQKMNNTIGLKVIVDFNTKTETITYNSSKGQLIDMVNPFVTKDNQSISYGEHITVNLKTRS